MSENVAVPAPLPVTCWRGWSFQVLLRNSSTTGPVSVARAPTRTGLAFDSHGRAIALLVVLPRKLMLAPSSRTTPRAALSALTAAIAAASCASATSVGVSSGCVPVASPISAYWLVE